MEHILRALIGIVVLIGIAWIFSRNKKKIDFKLVGLGIFLQIALGILLTQVPIVNDGFYSVSKLFVRFIDFSSDGAEFVFGGLAKSSFEDPTAGHNLGVIFAFRVLPTIVFFATISAGLYYLGILQKIVYVVAWVMSKFMRLSGAESLSAAGNIFLGQTEAPLLVKPFISKMTRSELMCLMTGGMATIAGGVMAAFVAMLGGDDPEQQALFAQHLLTASIMNAPAGIIMAKILIPETNPDQIDTKLHVSKETLGVNFIDAIARGASDGVKLAVNVGGMLLAFIALIFLLNYVLKDMIGEWTGLNKIIVEMTEGNFDGFSLQYIFGQLFRLLAFAMGVEWKDTLLVGSLLGQKTVINEFVAYGELSALKAKGLLGGKSLLISTFALCGFSNFSSIAIQIGGIGGMAPNRQGDLSKLGLKALLAATLACMLTATVAGAILSF